MNEQKQESKRAIERSPRYPSMPLATALDRARKLYKAEGKNVAAPEVVVKHWGYGGLSGASRSALAGLRSYGLLEDTKSGSKLTERALRIILDEREPSVEREEHIRSAALTPRMYKTLWDRYGANMPSDENLRHTLLFEYNFQQGAVDDFIKEFRGTLSFAKLDKPARLPTEAEAAKPPADEIEIGDLVQWESNGALQFEPARRVVGFSDDGEWVFVEGSATGIPKSEVRIETKAPALPKPPPAPSQFKGGAPMSPATMQAPANPLATGFRQDVFSLAEGNATITLPASLSSESFVDLEEWLKIVIRKAKRTVSDPDETGS